MTVTLKFFGILLAEDAPAFSFQEVFHILADTAAVLVDSLAQVPGTHGICRCESASLPVKVPVIGKDLDAPFGGSFPDFRSHVRGKKVETVEIGRAHV